MTKLYKLRITLEDIHPPIWRELVLPNDIPLDRLHDVLQIVMGWQDCHLHEFVKDKVRYVAELDPEFDFEPNSKEEGLYRLNDVVKRKGSSFQYVYDFGDNWAHFVTVIDTNVKPDIGQNILECTGGARACPPEDVGGAPGYERMIEALENPDDEENQEFIDWLGDDFDPDSFSTDVVNWALGKYLRCIRPRNLGWLV